MTALFDNQKVSGQYPNLMNYRAFWHFQPSYSFDSFESLLLKVLKVSSGLFITISSRSELS